MITLDLKEDKVEILRAAIPSTLNNFGASEKEKHMTSLKKYISY